MVMYMNVWLLWFMFFSFHFLSRQYESDELEKSVYQDYDSDSDVPEELKQDYVDEQTGDAPVKRSVLSHQLTSHRSANNCPQTGMSTFSLEMPWYDCRRVFIKYKMACFYKLWCAVVSGRSWNSSLTQGKVSRQQTYHLWTSCSHSGSWISLNSCSVQWTHKLSLALSGRKALIILWRTSLLSPQGSH